MEVSGHRKIHETVAAFSLAPMREYVVKISEQQ